ncbi:hypothetical protein HHI36_002226 [Cryptolaemus montrouzieri]|uniref:CCHC-type domain-containing protein n=1 Tax=Cryptolaemus montrouzieri TaxID=559131 RepID=A0ABD2PAH2_9CUCU
MIQCYKCLRYGHTASQCGRDKRCRNCGKGHEEDECESEIKCIYCEAGHAAVERICQEYQRQKKIKVGMAVQKITYYEADLMYKTKTEYNIVQNSQSFPQLPKQSLQENNVIQKLPATVNRQQYSQALKKNSNNYPNKKISVNISKKRGSPILPGYDLEEHKPQLLNYSPTYPTPCYKHITTSIISGSENDTPVS